MPFDSSWSAPAGPLSLHDDDVHVWRASLDRDPVLLRRYEQSLASEERARAARFKFARDRDRFIAGRGILRAILTRYLGRAESLLEFFYERAGKPRVRPLDGDVPLRFNLSHAGELAVYGVTRGAEIGIDLEAIRPHVSGVEIAQNYFSPREIAELCALPPERRDEAFLLGWTRKEAYIKALGAGLGEIPLDSFSVSLTPGAPVVLLSADSARWTLETFEPTKGFVGAIVVEGRGFHARLLDFDSTDKPTPDAGGFRR